MTQELPIQELSLFAGERPDGTPVVETVQATEPQQGQFQLEKSPAFLRNLARGDLIAVEKEKGSHTLIQRSGNLCIRVIAKNDITKIAGNVVPAIEKLGGVLDFQNDRMLVLSIHVSCGFQAIEQLLNKHVSGDECGWMYGNVYRVEDGELVPINWWQDFLKSD